MTRARLALFGLVCAFVLLFAFAISCTPRPHLSEPTNVSPLALVRAYRDTPRTADAAFTDQRVRILLNARDYSVNGRAIHWKISDGATPTIIFTVTTPPGDNSRDVELVGTCKGMIRDGIHRGSEIDFHLRIDECSAVVR